jgi:hypothetical protein
MNQLGESLGLCHVELSQHPEIVQAKLVGTSFDIGRHPPTVSPHRDTP